MATQTEPSWELVPLLTSGPPAGETLEAALRDLVQEHDQVLEQAEVRCREVALVRSQLEQAQVALHQRSQREDELRTMLAHTQQLLDEALSQRSYPTCKRPGCGRFQNRTTGFCCSRCQQATLEDIPLLGHTPQCEMKERRGK